MAIPEDIFAAEILPKLPVKSLLKFRCVSKSWCLLISGGDKQFIKSHMKNALKNSTSIIASVNQCLHPGLKHDYPLRLWSGEPSLISVDDFKIINDHTIQSDKSGCIVGSCNGLCCIRKGKQFFVWNPATKSSYMLPDLVPLLNTYTNSSNIRYRVAAGFGCNEATDDYKVLSVFMCSIGRDTVVALLYSSRTNSWKLVENFGDNTIYIHSFIMKFLNGSLHWQGSSKTEKEYCIYSFDLEREVFGLVEQPNYYDEGSQLLSLGVLDGCLSCTHGRRGHGFQVWIMKSYGVTKSWHKIASLRRTHDPYRYGVYVPICLTKDGGILFSYHRGFVIYDPKTESPRPLQWDKAWGVSVAIYVESLVTPVPVGALTTRSK